MKTYNQKLKKIYKKIEKLTLRGNSNLYEYQKYIDELIDKSQYSQFKDCLNHYYKIDLSHFVDVQDIKRTTWSLILFQSNTNTQKKLNTLYLKEKIYQQGFEIFDSETNTKLGEIKEIDNFDFYDKYQYSKTLYLDNEFAARTNIKRTFLEVYKDNEFLLVDSIDETRDEYFNEIERYKTAISFLKS
jgi:hypothetical protein|tara:strand:+ start:62 stop:622 length:561 start_codon:yes stop_codon:yes gene_type:complete